MDRIYCVNVGLAPNPEAISIFLESLIPADLACLLRRCEDDSDDITNGITIFREREEMFCDFGRPPGWLPGTTETDTTNTLRWRSYVTSANMLAFMLRCHKANTPKNIAFARDVHSLVAEYQKVVAHAIRQGIQI